MRDINVIAVFDIGKTNKKILLFNENLEVVFQEEDKFPTTVDEDGFECDDIDMIGKWVLRILGNLIKDSAYNLKAVNFSTYGASLVFLDKGGKRLAPVYNYLKNINSTIQSELFKKYGGETEFCRQTASPALGLMLNSGIQILWLKKSKPELFKSVASILHFPQYLSYILSNKIVSESTSLGCHTFMWDYDNNSYHPWIKEEEIVLPEPWPNNKQIDVVLQGHSLKAGIGIHDSSSALVPYLRGSKEPFLLVSTGTWCINMNPFNHTPLTSEQLKSDCLSFLSIDQKPVKSSRLFMGHIHDVNIDRLNKYFKASTSSYKKIKANHELILSYINSGKNKVFFKNGMPDNYVDEAIDLSIFSDFSEAYHRFMYDLTLLNIEAIDLILNKSDGVKSIYISGGFARNEIFVRLLASFYSHKKVFTSVVDNASALGAAIVVSDALDVEVKPEINLGLKAWEGSDSVITVKSASGQS